MGGDNVSVGDLVVFHRSGWVYENERTVCFVFKWLINHGTVVMVIGANDGIDGNEVQVFDSLHARIGWTNRANLVHL